MTRAKKTHLILPHHSLAESYHALCTQEGWSASPSQEAILAHLQYIKDALEKPRSFFKRRPHPVKGLYLWGDVGRGKTFLMDLFFQSLHKVPKRRQHFHAFMADLHQTLHREKHIDRVIEALAQEARVLCFDEFIVSNIADAMIMSRLFRGLFDAGVTLVATSNTAPEDLYKGGLHRERFLPFIDVLHAHVDIHTLEGSQDYRRLKIGEKERYFWGDQTSSHLQNLWDRLTDSHKGTPYVLENMGRVIPLGRNAKGVLWTTFPALCESPLGASDYLKLTHDMGTLMIESIPALDDTCLTEMQRFITLIDVLYDQGTLLILGADVPLDQLFPHPQLNTSIPRTLSRLHEMQHGR